MTLKQLETFYWVSVPDPAAIAETYYQLHLQPRSAWSHEADLLPYVEKF